MRRILLLVGLALLWLGLLPPTPAAADSDDWRITRYAVTAAVAGDGTTEVGIDFTFDFGTDEGHGPYVTLPLRQEIAGDPDHWRMLDVTLGQVSSPSGAPADVTTETNGGNLLVRIGDEDRTVTGAQRYHVGYRIAGLVAPRQAQSGLDEFNWNVIGGDWDVPISNISVAVTGPETVSRVACWVGGGTTPCGQAASDGTTATFGHDGVDAQTPLQVVAGFPAGTFTGAEARLEKRFWIGNMAPLTPWTGGLTAVLTALGLGALLRRTRRGARDEVYLGLTPGVVPAANQAGTVGRGSPNVPVAVAFTPPRGARPGEVGVLVDATADNADITATIIDLAVRGHLRIERVGEKDWTFHRLQGRDEVTGYESHLLEELFSAGPSVTTDELKDSDYSGVLTGTRRLLYQRVTGDLRWFSRNPSLVRGLAVVGGIALVATGVGLGFLLGLVGFGLVGLAVVACGVGVLIANNRFGTRTATGSAVLAQAKGFELYLTTAEADQIRFEEGIDVFSRYLPYAIVFGVAERWNRLFAQLAAQGRYTPDSSWYLGYGYAGVLDSGFVSSMDSLTSTMSASMQAATAATSGGSGFSGGGGFGGGGGGGW
jgi:hypothetical protein